MMAESALNTPDVTVIGGGLSGLAASIHLANAGMRVVCIEPQTAPRQPVGESLDWSSPALLGELGLPMTGLAANGTATYKRGVNLQFSEGGSRKYLPGPWLGASPFHIELRTLHVDRTRLDRRLIEVAVARGVTIVADKVVEVERSGERVAAVRTAGGARFVSPWFIDASGFAASLLAREFKLSSIEYGPRKVAIWTYFAVPLAREETTIYCGPEQAERFEWIWEIPIQPTIASVGCIGTADSVKQLRRQGLAVEEIFRRRLSQFPHFEPLLRAGWLCPPRTIAFACRTYRGVAGPNWMIAGEAASLVDPITSNGVTSALRHAREAAEIIVASRDCTVLIPGAAKRYARRVEQLSTFFNCGIERLVYDWPVRRRLGLERAARIYTIGAWVMNAIYSRVQPSGRASTTMFGCALGVMKGCAAFCNVLFARRARRKLPA